MTYLQLESARYGILPLNGILTTDRGMEAQPGMTGLGLPPVSVQWSEGAGDGARYKGRRVLPRDVDVPIYVDGKDREGLEEQVHLLGLILSDEDLTLRIVDETKGDSWYAKVARTGGGSYVYGTKDTTGENDLWTVITFRAGDPYWTHSEISSATVASVSGRGILDGSLTQMRVSSTSTLGEISMSNPGNADAYPVWTVKGPGTSFTATSETGETFTWTGTLTGSQALTIDSATGRVTDQTGASRYTGMAPSPRFWKIPPGESTANVTLSDSTTASLVTCTWRARKWLTI